jgi:hypothetical protein
MANLNDVAFRAADYFESGSATNAAATATRAAPGAGRRHVLTGVLITMSAAPTAGGAVTLTGAKAIGGPTGTTLHTIAAGGVLDITLPIRLECEVNTALSIALPALGVGVVGSVTLFGFTVGA